MNPCAISHFSSARLNTEKCAKTGLTAYSPPPYELTPHLSTLHSAGLSVACIHMHIYRQFNVTPTSTLPLSVIKRNTRLKGGGEVQKKCCAALSKGKVIQFPCCV